MEDKIRSEQKLDIEAKKELIEENNYGLKYNRGRINVVKEKNLNKVIEDVFGDITGVIKHTLGPFGGNTLVTESYGNSAVIPSKDGYRLMLNIHYTDFVYDTIYRIIRDISSRMNVEVGDGTTSSVIIADKLYKEIYNFYSKNVKITPYGIRTILTKIEEVLKNNLKEIGFVRPIMSFSEEKRVELYKKIASIASNNEYEVVNNVASIYEKTHSGDTYVNIEISDNDDTEIISDVGFEFPTGHIHKSMATESDGVTALYDDPKFLIIDGPLLDNDLEALQTFVRVVCMEAGKPLVIIASEYSQKILNFLIQCRIGFVEKEDSKDIIRFPIIALIISGSGDIGNARLKDLEVCLNASALPTQDGKLMDPPKDPVKIMKVLGSAKRIKTVPYYCRIFSPNSNAEEVKYRISTLKNEIDKFEYNDPFSSQERVATIKKRIAMLSQMMVTIKVGGMTRKEKEWKKLVYEDAIYAVRSAIINGVTIGGNISVSACIDFYKKMLVDEIYNNIISSKCVNITVGNNEEDLLFLINTMLEIVGNCFIEAYRIVLKNAFRNDDHVSSIINNIKKSFGNIKISPTSIEIYNLNTDSYEKFVDKNDNFANLIVPGNTDTEILHSVFNVISLFLTSNQLMSIHFNKD